MGQPQIQNPPRREQTTQAVISEVGWSHLAILLGPLHLIPFLTPDPGSTYSILDAISKTASPLLLRPMAETAHAKTNDSALYSVAVV